MGLRIRPSRTGRVLATGALAFFAIKGICWLVLAALAAGGIAKVTGI